MMGNKLGFSPAYSPVGQFDNTEKDVDNEEGSLRRRSTVGQGPTSSSTTIQAFPHQKFSPKQIYPALFNRKKCFLPKLVLSLFLVLLIGYVILKTVMQRGRGDNSTVPPQFWGTDPNVVNRYEGMSGEVNEKLRHQFPFLTKDVGLTIEEAKESNVKFFKDASPATADTGAPGEAPPKQRYQSYVILDKPVYRPGEILRATMFVLNVLDGSQVPENSIFDAGNVVIKDAKGVHIGTVGTGRQVNGVWSFQFQIPSAVAGGDFQLSVEPYEFYSITKFSTKFEVRATRVSNAKINKKLEFSREGYGAGDKVQATVFVDGTQSTTVLFTASLDSETIFQSESVKVVGGEAKIEFQLPSRIRRGEGVLVAKVRAGPILEAVSKTIPIITQSLDIGVFPEGGVLVPGGGNQRVYVEALDGVNGRPVDFSAEIFSDADTTISLATVKSKHEGRGVSSMFAVPGKANRVFLVITSPASVEGQKTEIPLRSLRASPKIEIISLSTPAGSVFQNSVTATLSSSAPLSGDVSYQVGLFRKEKEIELRKLSAVEFKVAKGEIVMGRTTFDLTSNNEDYGVLRLTLLTAEGLPVAERLVFRLPPRALEIELESTTVDDVSDLGDVSSNGFTKSKIVAAPSDGIAVRVRTWMRNVNPLTGDLEGPRSAVSSVVALRVTDSALAATVESRLLPSRLPPAVLLEAEVDRFNDAGAFLPGTMWGWNANANSNREETSTFLENVDLLLGTQGWRMFAYYDAQGFFRNGKAPLLHQRLVPVGYKASEKNGKPSAPVDESSSSSTNQSPISKVSLERLLGIVTRRPQPTLGRGGAHPVMFAKVARHQNFDAQEEEMQEVPMMAMAAAAGPAEDMVAEVAAGAPPPPMEQGGDFLADNGNNNQMAEDQLPQGADRDDEAMEPVAPVMGKRMAAPEAANAMFWRRPEPQYERVYVHPQRKYLKKEMEIGAKRNDFIETVYFNPSLKTVCGGTNGDVCEAIVSFGLSDSSSASFVVHADGLVPNKKLVLGCSHMYIDTKMPLEVDLSLPSVIVQGDRPSVPVIVRTSKMQDVALKVSVSPMALLTTQNSIKEYKLEKGDDDSGGERVYLDLVADKAVRGQQQVNVTINGITADDNKRDTIVRSTILMPRGFPASQFDGGVLKKEPVPFNLKLPQDYVGGSLEVNIRAYTSPVGRLTKALEALIREPCGCFEQTSSTTYPLVFVLQYLKTHSDSSPDLIRKASEMLKRGYDKLASFESPGGGFEWFGAEPGHEALTAYGLLQFAAMSSPTVGLSVDPNMIERTKKWMQSRRDGEGGFLRNERALDSFGAAPIPTTNAYITWALVRAGLLKSRENDKEVAKLVEKAIGLTNDPSSQDPYIVALAALSLYDATSPSKEQLVVAAELATKLTQYQDDGDGSVKRGAKDTITRSQGEALLIETTALSVLVWLHAPEQFAANARMGVDFLASKCKNGRFASTQATALSLMAIVEFDKVFTKPLPKGKVELTVDGAVVQQLSFGGPKAQTPADGGSSEPAGKECSGGAVWNECGSACLRTCDTPDAQMCTENCVQRCECPPEKPILGDNGVCVVECTGPRTKPDDVDAEGIISFSPEKILKSIAENPKAPHRFGLRLVLEDTSSKDIPSIPYSIAFKYSVLTPIRGVKASTPQALQLSVKMDSSDAITEGDVVTIRASVKNVAKEDGKDVPVPMVVAVIGIPGGFEPRTDQLRELKDSKLVDFVESQPGQIILYWRALAPSASLDIPLQVVATIPGTYESPASRAYLFYNDEDKTWAKGFAATIQPQKRADGKPNKKW